MNNVGKTHQGALWSMILGIAGWLCLSFLGAIPAVILGHISRKEIGSSDGRYTGEGMALAGLILGYSNLALTGVAIVAAIFIPNLVGAREAAMEVRCLQTIKQINTALIIAADSNGDGIPPATLNGLLSRADLTEDMLTCPSLPKKGVISYTYHRYDSRPLGSDKTITCNSHNVSGYWDGSARKNESIVHEEVTP